MRLSFLSPKKLVFSALSLLIVLSAVQAAPDTRVFQEGDLLLYFRNPAGSVNTDRVVVFGLGSTWNVFRRAATPSDPTSGTVISLGNINTFLASSTATGGYGSDWTSLSSTIWVGAVGQNGPLGTGAGTENGDYSRTVYVSKARLGTGIYQQANSDPLTRMGGSASGQNSVAVAINGSGGPFFGDTTPLSNPNEFTAAIITGNPIDSGSLGNGYSLYQGGVMTQISSITYNYGPISNVVAALDIYRQTPVLNAEGWQNINNIEGVVAREGYYLGTVTLSSNGSVHFVGRADGTPPPPEDDYTVWTQGYPGAELTDKEGDYDGDGFKNVAEYAFGTDPTVGNKALSSAAVASNNLSIGFFRRSTTNSEAPTYSVLSTTNLVSAFTNNAASISILTNAAPPGYQAASFTQPVAGSKFFYRIQATLPQGN